MNISFIIILGLPLLYVTGSLKKIVANANISGVCFVMYFVCTAMLSFVPIVNITQEVSINAAGAFFCIAPAIYLSIKKEYDYKFFIPCAMAVLVSIASAFLQNSYTLPYLPYIVDAIFVMIAIFCFKESAPIFVPVLIGVYNIFWGVMQIFISTYNINVFFNAIEMTSISIAVCLFTAYFATKSKGRHAIRNNCTKKDIAT